MQTNIDRNQSIEELEGPWQHPVSFPSSLVENVYKYRKLILNDLTVEQLRLLIGQQEALSYLVPIAFELLEKNILTEGDFYEGDLLSAILCIDNSFWSKNHELQVQLRQLILEKQNEVEKISNRQLRKQIENFAVK